MKTNITRIFTIVFAILICSLTMANAETYLVTNTNDGLTEGTLRLAILEANGNPGADVIDATQVNGTITLTFGVMQITDDVTIIGPGVSLLSVSGNDQSTVFFILSRGNVHINDLTITGGNASSDLTGVGGGILIGVNTGNVTLTLANTVVSGNKATISGGGIYALAAKPPYMNTLNIINSTIANNSAAAAGGIYNAEGNTVNVVNSTISGNSAAGNGAVGGIENIGWLNITNSTITANSGFYGGINNYAIANVKNTIIAGNISNTSIAGAVPDFIGPVTSQGYNLVGVVDGSDGWIASDLTGIPAVPLNPLLGPLANNGGPTFTHALLTGSPAINAGSNALAVDADNSLLTTDQRGVGFPRITGSSVDVGAYELQSLQTFYRDADGDSYGDPSDTKQAVIAPEGYVSDNTDCDDGNEAVNPGAAEICDGIDNNCDGNIDEGFINTDGDAFADCVDPDDDNDGTPDAADCAPLDAAKWRTGNFYTDSDGDGYGSGSPINLCYGATTPTGYSTVGGDCNDANANIKPGAVEICGNNIDDNCNGQVDENCSCVNVTVSTSTISCYGGLATITVYASGGKAPYKYKLSGRLSYQLNNYFVVCAGTYSVTIVDKTGCTRTISNIVITQPAPLTLTVVQKKDVTCRNGTNGSISVNAGGGTIPYSYKLNSGSYGSSGTFQNLKAGTYKVTVRDAKGCCKSISVTIKNGTGSCSSYALTGKTLELFDAKLSPNPAIDEFTLRVSGNSSEPVNIRVVDMYGKTRYITKGAAGQAYRFGEHFAAGVYIIEIIQGENKKIIKAIKQ